MSGKQRIFFTPVGAETLAIEGGQLWYGDEQGLGSTSDMSRFFKAGSIKLGSDEDGNCRSQVKPSEDNYPSPAEGESR